MIFGPCRSNGRLLVIIVVSRSSLYPSRTTLLIAWDPKAGALNVYLNTVELPIVCQIMILLLLYNNIIVS